MKLKLVKATEYFFLLKKISNNIKLNKDIIKINFQDELLYKNVFFLKKKDYLYIYNTDYDKRIFIPEGFILYSSLEEEGIFIFKNPNGYYNVIIKQNNILKNDFVIKKLNDFIKTSLSYEYSLPIIEKDYETSIKLGFKKVSYLDLFKLSNLFSFNKQKIKNYISQLSLPFLIAMVLLYISVMGIKIFYENKYKTLEYKYETIKEKFALMDNKIKIIKSLSNNIHFIKNYLNPKVLKIANAISKVVYDTKFRLSYLKVDYQNKYILFTIDGNNSTLILEKLSNLKYLKNLRLSSEVPLNKNTKRYRFEGQIND